MNPLDTKIREGKLPAFMLGKKWPPKEGAATPFIPNADYAGVVVSAPSESGLKPGDRVFGLTMRHGDGAYAEYVAVPASEAGRIPDGVSFVDAAASAMVRHAFVFQVADLLLILRVSLGGPRHLSLSLINDRFSV